MWETILSVVVGISVVVAVYFLIKIMGSKENAIDLVSTIKTAVQAAEKLFGDGEGTSKLSFVTDYLDSIGIALESEELTVLINSAIYEMESETGTSHVATTSSDEEEVIVEEASETMILLENAIIDTGDDL